MKPSTFCMVASMDTPFLTIAEAATKTGRSASTIRRVIHTITQDDTHPDRAAIEPTPKQVAALKKKGENFAWKVREDVIVKNFKGALKEEKKSATSLPTGILDILQKELELKNQQIEKQWEVIHALNDRLREGNILMGSLQKRLGPPQAEQQSEQVVEASSTKASAQPSSKSFFGWMRGR